MPRYAHFDRDTGAILNWMDTEAYSYADMPPADQLLELTDEEYGTGPAGKTVKKGVLADYEPPVPTLDDLKFTKIAELATQFSRRMAVVKANYPDEEVQSWFKQESEARSYTSDKSVATPLLAAMAAARGITVDDLVARVIANADAYSKASGQIIGARQKYVDAVNAAKDAASVSAVVWSD